MRAAVDVATGAVLAQGTGQDVAEGEEAAVALALADDSLVALADVADLVVAGLLVLRLVLVAGLLVAGLALGGSGDGGGSKGKDSDEELHFEGWWVFLDWCVG